jgi:hypothetical protein
MRNLSNLGREVLEDLKRGGQAMPRKGHTEEEIVEVLQQVARGQNARRG